MDLTVTSLVVCDDIRREINNKDILIGAYGSGLTVHQLPSTITLAFWLEFATKKVGASDLFLRFHAPNSHPPFEVRVNMELIAEQESYAVFTPPLPILVEREGRLRIFLKTRQSAKYEQVKSLKIVYTPFTDSGALLQTAGSPANVSSHT